MRKYVAFLYMVIVMSDVGYYLAQNWASYHQGKSLNKFNTKVNT